MQAAPFVDAYSHTECLFLTSYESWGDSSEWGSAVDLAAERALVENPIFLSIVSAFGASGVRLGDQRSVLATFVDPHRSVLPARAIPCIRISRLAISDQLVLMKAKAAAHRDGVPLPNTGL